MKLLERYDNVLRRHFSEATVFVGTSPQVQNDLIHCMSRVMKEEICDVSKREQLSLVFRYFSKFRVCERFIEFIECRLERNAESVAAIAISKIEEYKVGPKLVAQTYDGASVMAGEITGVNVRVNEKYQEALFIHCYAHKLNLVLSQSVRRINACKPPSQCLYKLNKHIYQYHLKLVHPKV